MKVREAMAETISCAATDHTVADVARMMRDEAAGFVPVVDEERRLLGVVTDRDLVLRCLAGDAAGDDPRRMPAAAVMSTDDLAVVTPDDDLEEAARVMAELEVRRLPVLAEGRLVGILSHGNLVQATRGEGPGTAATLGVTRGA
jgi:CBS domain-containing protein